MSSGDDEFPGVDYPRVNEDVLRSITQTTWKYYLVLGILGMMVLAGAGVYYYQTVNGLGVWGVNEPNYWGLDIPTFIFWIGFSLSGTLLSAILLLTKSHWRNPIYRVAELITGFALITAAIVVLTHVGRPWRVMYNIPYPNLRQLWTNFRSPLMADVLGIVAYLTSSLTFLIVGSIPDFAALRNQTKGWRKRLYTILSFGWKGSNRQWLHFRRTYLMIAAFIIPVAISMHSVTAWVPSMTINPGAHSTIFPLLFVVGALLSGVAGVIMIVIIVRKYLKFEEYMQLKHLDHLAKLVLIASLLISYIYLIEIFVPSYKAENFEFMPLMAKVVGRYAPMYWTMILCNSVFPLLFFARRFRRNITVLFLVSVGIQVGMYIERLLMVIPTQTLGPLPSTWGTFTPSWVEIALLIWELSIFAFLMMGAVKIVPALSIFEVKELLPVPNRAQIEPRLTVSEKAVETPPPVFPPDEFVSSEVSTSKRGRRRESGVLGVFAYLDDALKSVKELKSAGFKKIEFQSPIPLDAIDQAMKPETDGASLWQRLKDRNIHVVRFSLVGAIGGGVGLAVFSIATAINYPIQTSGLPIISLPTVAWTSAVFSALLGLLVSVVGLFVLGRLATFKLGIYSPRTTLDRFAVVLMEDNVEQLARGKDIIEGCGGEVIEEMEFPG